MPESPLMTWLILGKVIRFLAGLLITFGAGWLGALHARRLNAQGISWDAFQAGNSLDRKKIVPLALGLSLVGAWYLLEQKFQFFKPVEGFLQQGGLVTLRSVLVFLFVLQWNLATERVRLKRALWAIVPSILIMTGVEAYHLWPMALQVNESLISRHGVVIQTTGYTCAPASLATLMRLYGKPMTEVDASVLVGGGMGGSFDDEITAGAKAAGFPDALPWTGNLDAIASEDLPLIVSIRFHDVWDMHAVALIGLSSTTVTLADPMGGLRRIPRDRFHEHWRGRGVRFGRPSFPFDPGVRLSTFHPGMLKR